MKIKLLYLFVQDEDKKEFGMRRSASERKLTKKKKDERKDKSRKTIKNIIKDEK